MIACWCFMGSFFVLTFYVMYVTSFFLLLFCLCPFLKNQIVWFGFDLRVFFGFYSFFFSLINSLQKNKLSGSLSWFNPVWLPWVFFS